MGYEDRLEMPANGTSLDLLRAVYQNPSIPLPVRIRCAVACLPHEHPRLMVTAQIQDQDFASLLDARIKNHERLEKELTNGGVIEAKPTQTKSNGVDVKPYRPHVVDRRYRRI